MPYKNPDQRRAAERRRMRIKYRQDRDRAVQWLGGKCVVCGSTDRLEFDHIDPATKTVAISSLFPSASWELIVNELKKCQLLCTDHHEAKSKAAPSPGSARKLSEWQAIEIRADGRAYKTIAQQYGIAYNTVWKIKAGRLWLQDE